MSGWANIPSHLNPVAFNIGAIKVHWYGIMYLVAFCFIYALVWYRIKTEKFSYSRELIDDLFFWGILCVMIGGRLGYVLFYNLGYYLHHPLNIVLPFVYDHGWRYVGIRGMSYHGALLTVVGGIFIFCRKNNLDFWKLSELLVPAVPLGYTFGRLGNFINGELYGRVTTVPWGMYFPLDPTHQLRHPSQLYEAFFEGIVLFVILWALRKNGRFDGFLLAVYLIGYGVMRFFIEFVRQPDPQLGFVLGPFTMGQVLCTCMIVAGLLIIQARRPRAHKA